MTQPDCSSSWIKNRLKEELIELSELLRHHIEQLPDENVCLMKQFESMRTKMTHLVTTAASYYLNCYLSPYTAKYEAISTSVQHLSERRHGALIVVERNDPLDSLIRSGIPIGGAVSHSLLESVFYPGNPLHDGAVLIRSDVIVSAANVLPLSDAVVEGQKFGTRHRAALGLSERSDALVLVVSEETGQASFALKGAMHPIPTVSA